MKKVLIVVGVIVALLVATYTLFLFAVTKPYAYSTLSYFASLYTSVTGPRYKMVTDINYGGYGAKCAHPILAKKERKLVYHMNGSSWETLYLPVNETEAKLFCHKTWIE